MGCDVRKGEGVNNAKKLRNNYCIVNMAPNGFYQRLIQGHGSTSSVLPSKRSFLSRVIKLSLEQDGNGFLDFKELGTAFRYLGLELDDKETTDLMQAFDKEETGQRHLHLTGTTVYQKSPYFSNIRAQRWLRYHKATFKV